MAVQGYCNRTATALQRHYIMQPWPPCRDPCLLGAYCLSAPLPFERGPHRLSDIDAIAAPGASFALHGPSVKLDPARLPVRGDLAHIRLAGKVFVPHYVVPMPCVVNGGGTPLLNAGKPEAEVMAILAEGTLFQLLDVTGDWAWGQVGDDGAVGYVSAAALKSVP